MNIKHLEAFAAVADLGGFRKAAERLGTTQPNISTRIAALEDRLGVTLMERDAGSVRLTPKGVEMLHKAREVLRAFEDFVAAADDGSLFEGVIRLGVTEMMSTCVLPARVALTFAVLPTSWDKCWELVVIWYACVERGSAR